ncbi:hypothetical protein AURDEDRAFT_149144 [Auricularia subglabra TFB-10046 SS5]|nr:hypothetical protein AURDEDRAFT_149144 [Auricularia subglabra TFB-10046 SS5]
MSTTLAYVAHPLDRTARLPVELLWAVMDSMSLAEILNAAHVCRRWRAAAFEHNTFRTDIRLYQSTPLAVELFVAQLERSRTSPITFDIRIPTSGELWNRLVMPALFRCIARITHLTIWIDVSLATLPFTALLAPAPLLETFTLHLSRALMHHNSRSNPRQYWWEIGASTIPIDIFRQTAPRLHTFRGKGVRFPNEEVPAFSRVYNVELFGDAPRRSPETLAQRDSSAAWLTGVAHLPGGGLMPWFLAPHAGAVSPPQATPQGHAPRSYAVRGLQFSPVATAACFPRMKALSLSGHTLELIASSPSVNLRDEDHTKLLLKRLTLDLELTCSWTLSTQVEAATTPFIRLVDGSYRAVAMCMEHITGPTHLRMLHSFESAGRSFTIDAIDFESERKRTFEEYYSTYDAGLDLTRLSAFLLTPDLCQRIVTFTLSQSLWAHLAVAVWIPEMPAAERLVFVIDVEDSATHLHPLSTQLHLPALKHFAVATVFETRQVHASDLAAIVGGCLHNPPSRLSFWICEGVVVRGRFDPRNVVSVGALPRFVADA